MSIMSRSLGLVQLLVKSDVLIISYPLANATAFPVGLRMVVGNAELRSPPASGMYISNRCQTTSLST